MFHLIGEIAAFTYISKTSNIRTVFCCWLSTFLFHHYNVYNFYFSGVESFKNSHAKNLKLLKSFLYATLSKLRHTANNKTLELDDQCHSLIFAYLTFFIRWFSWFHVKTSPCKTVKVKMSPSRVTWRSKASPRQNRLKRYCFWKYNEESIWIYIFSVNDLNILKIVLYFIKPFLIFHLTYPLIIISHFHWDISCLNRKAIMLVGGY